MILTFQDLECRDSAPSRFRVSGFYTDPIFFKGKKLKRDYHDLTDYILDYVMKTIGIHSNLIFHIHSVLLYLFCFN